MQPFRSTSTPETVGTNTPAAETDSTEESDGAGTPTAEPLMSTVVPLATQVIDPETLVFEDGWQLPTNLSSSGGTSVPQLVLDSNGTAHVFWSDAVEGFGYTFRSGEVWSKPVASEYPFFTRRYFPDLQDETPTPLYTPLLAADGRGQLYAFWVGDESVLYYSSVPSTSFSDYDSWTPRSALTDQSLTLTTTTGPDGRLHILYVRSEESDARPAGVYYQQLDSSGTWSAPTLLYASRYLRTVPADVANLQLLAPDIGSVYAVWDDTLKEQIYFAGSSDNGFTWNTPQEIDRRGSEDAESSAGPANITLGARDEQLHLSWSAGHEQGQECSQYNSLSIDGGATWTSREALTTLPRCFSTAQLIAAGDTFFLFGTTEEEAELNSLVLTTYLLAWDGSRWSEPQIQEPLSSFSNPETNQAVRLQCHLGLGQENAITLMGCDSAGREAGEFEEWFPPPPVWQGPDEVASGGSQPAESRLVASSDGAIHAFWNETNSGRIYRAGWDGENWSSGQEVLTSPGGDVAALTAAGAGDRLFLAWEDAVRGLQFSAASSSNPSQWSDPASLVSEQPAASSPSIIADAGGNVFLAFAIQLNEARGVYLIHSADAGETWSTPIQIFDAPAAGWEMVDKPILTRTENGEMHLIWTRHSLPPDGLPLGLAYSRSDDLGQTRSISETVVEAQTFWSDLAGAGERFVHHLWSEESDIRQGIWHRYSLDGGLTWSQAERIAGLNGENAISMTVDPGQRVHLLTLANGQLGDLVWDDELWIESDGLETALGEDGNLTAASNQNGQLVAVYAGNLASDNSEEVDGRLFAMSRMLELPEDLPEPLPTLTPTPLPTQPAVPTATPEPTATTLAPGPEHPPA